jgi:hypothetical protein
MRVVHSSVAVAEAARTDAVEVDHQTVVETLGKPERQEQHKSAATEGRDTVACTWEVVVKYPVAYVSKDGAELAENDLLCHFVLGQAAPALMLALHLQEWLTHCYLHLLQQQAWPPCVQQVSS